MKKTLLALAALTVVSGAAFAQSSVTMYGRVDLSVGKNLGEANKNMQNGSGSRLGLRGSEDLGGGMSAVFNIETRFDADTGGAQSFNVTGLTPTGTAATTSNRFWGARSFVGLRGGFGQVVLGREYTTAFLGNQLIADPWGWDTVANQAGITGLGGIAKVRNDSSITYNVAAGGFSFGAQVAEATDTINKLDSKPFNMSVGYAGGPFRASLGYEKTGRVNEKMTSVMASYNLGFIKPGFFYGKGTTVGASNLNADRTGMMFTVTAPVGAGELRASYGTLKSDSNVANTAEVTISKRLAVGYHYSMSKRTTLYADFARESADKLYVGTAVDANRTGYDFGIKHNF